MDIDRLKEVSHVQWCPPSMLIPVQDQKDAKRIVFVDMLEWVNKMPEFENGQTHEASFNVS